MHANAGIEFLVSRTTKPVVKFYKVSMSCPEAPEATSVARKYNFENYVRVNHGKFMEKVLIKIISEIEYIFLGECSKVIDIGFNLKK